MKRNIVAALALAAAVGLASTAGGGGPGLRVGAGIQGAFSMFEAGFELPKLNGSFGIGLRARYLSALTYATYIDSAGDYVSFHPCVIGGAVSFGGCSPVIAERLRAYGSFEVLLGHSFTPWDNAVTGAGNLFGPNLTWVASGQMGLEVFTGSRTAVYLESGGGFKSIRGDEDNRHVSATAWLGSGVTLRVGVNFYL
jgi:hypothetical protein